MFSSIPIASWTGRDRNKFQLSLAFTSVCHKQGILFFDNIHNGTIEIQFSVLVGLSGVNREKLVPGAS